MPDARTASSHSVGEMSRTEGDLLVHTCHMSLGSTQATRMACASTFALPRSQEHGRNEEVK